MLTLSRNDITALAAAVDSSITGALDGTLPWWKSGSKPANEPDAVAAVVSGAFPNAATAWTGILKPLGYQVQIIGIFCHQTPKVQFKDTRSGSTVQCELADILVVIDEGIASPPSDRRALLIQAKSARHHKLNGPELIQLDLYQNYPAFKFNSGSYPPNPRDVTPLPGSASDGFAYGLIEYSPLSNWEHVAPANPLPKGTGVSLGEIVADMAAGAGGREAYPHGADDWSDTVEELLSRTASAMAGGSFGGKSRGVTTIAFSTPFEDGVGVGFFYRPPEIPTEADGPFGAVSVVHITLRPDD